MANIEGPWLGFQEKTKTYGNEFPTVVTEIPASWKIYWRSLRWGFEAKPTIRSLGELIRQINLYRTYDKELAYFYVVSPDDRHAETLAAQRIGFIKAPENLTP